MDRDPFDLIGDVLDGQFRVDAFAGEGDLSVVYKGHHLGVDAPVAIKCLNLPETLDRALARPLVDGFNEARPRSLSPSRRATSTSRRRSPAARPSCRALAWWSPTWCASGSRGSRWRRSSRLAVRPGKREPGRSVDGRLSRLPRDGLRCGSWRTRMHIRPGARCTFRSTRATSSSSTAARRRRGRARGPLPEGARLRRREHDEHVRLRESRRPLRGARPSGGAFACSLPRLRGAFGAAPIATSRGRSRPVDGRLRDRARDDGGIAASDRIVMGETETGAIVEHALDERRRPTPQAHGLKLPSHIERALARAVSRAPA